MIVRARDLSEIPPLVPLWHRLGLALCAAGLLGQTYRDFVSITTGIAPRDSEIPWWIFKDYGIVMLGLSYGLLRHQQSNKPDRAAI